MLGAESGEVVEMAWRLTARLAVGLLAVPLLAVGALSGCGSKKLPTHTITYFVFEDGAGAHRVPGQKVIYKWELTNKPGLDEKTVDGATFPWRETVTQRGELNWVTVSAIVDPEADGGTPFWSPAVLRCEIVVDGKTVAHAEGPSRGPDTPAATFNVVCDAQRAALDEALGTAH